MRLTSVIACCLYLVCCVCYGNVAVAEEVVEAWRSPFGRPRCVSVDPRNGSCWASVGSSVIHFGADGSVLSQNLGFGAPQSVAVDSSDGSSWVADRLPSQLVRLAEDGTELWRNGNVGYIRSLSANPTDGSCWVAASQSDQSVVLHLSSEGAELLRIADLSHPKYVAVNPTDGSCWVACLGMDGLVHLAADGTELCQVPAEVVPLSISVNSTDASCWVTLDLNTDGQCALVHFSENGTELWRNESFSEPAVACVDSADGSCWVTEARLDRVTHLSQGGTQLWRGTAFAGPEVISVNPVDHSCWLVDLRHVVHLASDGSELSRTGEAYQPLTLSVNPTDGSCWLDDIDRVVHLASDGTVLWQGGDFVRATSVSVNERDSTCWVADHWGETLTHLAPDGAVLWSRWPHSFPPREVAVNPVDGSLWVNEVRLDISGPCKIIHRAADGTLIAHSDVIYCIFAIAVDRFDRSCWVATGAQGRFYRLASDCSVIGRFGEECMFSEVAANWRDGTCWVAGSCVDDPEYEDRLVHLTRGGLELASIPGFSRVRTISVNPRDDSLWIIDAGRLLHLASDGTILWQSEDPYSYSAVAVNPEDGSCWVADTGHGQVARLVVTGSELPTFRDVPLHYWAYAEIEACAAAGIVSGYPNWTYGPLNAVTRDQMAVFISRSICTPTGEAGLVDYTPPETATFPDVSTNYWAYKYIEYAAEHNIVGGYPDGFYRPNEPVNRGQMAVFVARAMVAPSGDPAVLPGPAEPTFPDVTSTNAWSWCYDHVEYIAERGITQGYFDGYYHPEYTCTRDQMAVYITRAFDLPM